MSLGVEHMVEEKKEGLYETLVKISKGDVELFKDETENFLTVVGQYTGAAVKMQRSVSPIKEHETADVATAVK
jgi:hypothetical protein